MTVPLRIEVDEHDDHVEVVGATGLEVRLALQLLKAARELQLDSADQARAHMASLIHTAGLELIPPASLEQARRLHQLRAALLATPALDYETLAELRGDSSTNAARTWVTRQRAAHRLFTVTDGGRSVIPAFQLDASGSPRPELAPLLTVLRGHDVDGWQLWTWLVSATPLLSGEIPHEVAATAPARALKAAQRFAAHYSAKESEQPGTRRGSAVS